MPSTESAAGTTANALSHCMYCSLSRRQPHPTPPSVATTHPPPTSGSSLAAAELPACAERKFLRTRRSPASIGSSPCYPRRSSEHRTLSFSGAVSPQQILRRLAEAEKLAPGTGIPACAENFSVHLEVLLVTRRSSEHRPLSISLLAESAAAATVVGGPPAGRTRPTRGLVDDDGLVLTRFTPPPIRTHTFNGLFSGTTQVSRYQKGRTNLDFTEARDSEWQRHQLGRMQVCPSLQTDNLASTSPLSFLQAECPSCRPTNSVKALKAFTPH